MHTEAIANEDSPVTSSKTYSVILISFPLLSPVSVTSSELNRNGCYGLQPSITALNCTLMFIFYIY